MKKSKLLALFLALVMLVSLMPITALAADTKDADAAILGEGSVDLHFDAKEAYVGNYTMKTPAGTEVEFSCYRAAYCANPITGLTWADRPSEDYFKLNIYVPVGYTDEQLAEAPVLIVNPWGGDNGAAVNLNPSNQRRKMPAMALERGWVVVEPGMRGNNCYTGTLGGEDYHDYGKLPYPIVDLKAAVRYLRYGDNETLIPGNMERIFYTGTSSGGDATVMIGSSGNSKFFEPYLEELGAADERDDVFCAAPSCPVMNREWGDPAIAWERWGDLSDDADALKLNAALCDAYIEYLNSLGLKAEFDVPEAGIKAGDALTDENYADYLLVYEKQAAVKFLNSLGGKEKVEEYLASEKGTDMYGHPAISRDMLKPVYSEDGKTVVDLDNTWEEIWFYNVGGEEHMNTANVLNMQYDTPIDEEDLTAFEENGVLNIGIGARADGKANASNYTFGKANEYACVLSAFGQDWLENERGMTVSQEYRDLIAMQNQATNPLYFISGEGATDEVTVAPNWYMRTGSVDLVVPTPNFFALAVSLENRGYDVDAALVWDQSHGETTDLDGFFKYAAKLLAKDEDPTELSFNANSAYKGTYTYQGVEFSTYQVTYCSKPITGLTWAGKPSEDYFKMNIKVPTGMTKEELAEAPILIYNPWGGDRGSAVSAVDVLAFKAEPEIVIKTAIQNGWVVVEPGMRGANCYTGTIGEDDYYNYGKLPYPIVDLKAAIRYLRNGDNETLIPGDKEHMFIAGKSSGGDATVMIASSGNAEMFEPYLEEIGAADERDDVYGAYAYCPVMMRSEGDNAIAWERWGDLSNDSTAADVNIALTKDYIEYFNSLGIKAEFAVPSANIKEGDLLTADNYADYLLVYEKQAAVKFLNGLGGKNAIDEYLKTEKSKDMYGHPAISRNSLKPVYAEDGNTVIDLDNTWEEIWYYNVGGEEHMNTANVLNFQYDKPFYYAEVEENAVLNSDQSAHNNASTQSFGAATDYAAVFSEFGQAWAVEKFGISINEEYEALYDIQRNSVDPMYWVAGDGEGASDVAPVWFMRSGTVDLVVPTPNFVALATALENRGNTVNAELVWDDGHVIGKNTWLEFFAYADKTMGRAAFNDVVAGDWYYDSVKYVFENGLMNGTGDSVFEPGATVNRAMVVTVLYRMAGSPAVEGQTKFTDLSADWYKNAVLWAVNAGVTNGVSETAFNPTGAITREQLAAMLYRYAQYAKLDVSKKAELSGYTDAGSISAYAKDALAWANAAGLITGETQTTLNPTGASSRAVLATVLTRFCETLIK